MKQSSRPTLKAIAKQLGISVTTVSRALNGKAEAYGISKKTEEAVLRAAKEMHFSPDPLARGLRLNRTLSIGLLIPDISNPYFAEIARNVEMAARREGYSVILCDSQESTQLEIESLALLRDRKVDGLVIAPVGQSAAHLEELQDGSLPLVPRDVTPASSTAMWAIADLQEQHESMLVEDSTLVGADDDVPVRGQSLPAQTRRARVGRARSAAALVMLHAQPLRHHLGLAVLNSAHARTLHLQSTCVTR